jgi:hypothetical protein
VTARRLAWIGGRAMWSFLFLAGYVGRIERRGSDCDFDSLVRANRAREDDARCGFGRLGGSGGGGASSRAPHLRTVRWAADGEQR